MRAEAIYKSESCILILNIPYLQKVNKEQGLITYIILGIKASLEQKKHEKEPKKHEKNKKDNVIDFLSYLKKKRGEEEQFEEEIKDPF